jgi:hypothetical protein
LRSLRCLWYEARMTGLREFIALRRSEERKSGHWPGPVRGKALRRRL